MHAYVHALLRCVYYPACVYDVAYMYDINCGYYSRAALIYLCMLYMRLLFEGGYYSGCGCYLSKYGICKLSCWLGHQCVAYLQQVISNMLASIQFLHLQGRI